MEILPSSEAETKKGCTGENATAKIHSSFLMEKAPAIEGFELDTCKNRQLGDLTGHRGFGDFEVEDFI